MELENVSRKLLKFLKAYYKNSKLEYKNPPTRFGQGIATYIYRFQLKNVQPILSQPLVLRLFPADFLEKLAVKEGTIQNVLHDENYPVAKAHIICEEEKWLGGEFLIMDFLNGETMGESLPTEVLLGKLAETHVNLHKINPATVIEKLRTCSIKPEWYDGTIFIDTHAKKSEILKPALKWMKENEPSNRQNVICHGDFHPFNILVDDGKVSGVLDWSASRVGEPERDVASTFCNYAIYGPMAMPDVDWVGVAENYVQEYQLLSILDTEKLDYYKAVNSIGAIEVLALYQLAQNIPLDVKERAISLLHEYSGISL